MSAPLKIIDFHTHYLPASLAPQVVHQAPASERGRWEAIAHRLSDEALLLDAIAGGDVDARVVNASPALIADAEGRVAHDTTMMLNDAVAELAARHPGRIHGLATIDAYDGERSAREAERAIRELGMRGLFVDCARGELMIDAPQARPTLEVAARLKVPVFVHPVAPQPLASQMAPYGIIGALFARGTANSAALIALLEGGTFAALPGLRMVFTALAFGGLATAAGLSGQSLMAGGAIATLRRHVWIDTTMLQPALLRAAAGILGTGNLVVGSDWPIVNLPMRERLVNALDGAGFSADEQHAIAGGNAARLLGLH
jgi:aminocarboxymuconate-semialdehyde decarboxylase